MEEFRKQLIRSAMSEIDDVKKYMDLSKQASDVTMGILKDIAHDEYTHANHLVQIIEREGSVPEDLMKKWEECEAEYQNV